MLTILNRSDEGSLLAIGTLNLRTDAQVSNWLKTNWFPNASDSQISTMMSLYPQDPTQGVSLYSILQHFIVKI